MYRLTPSVFRHSARQQQHGITLIESMVALVVAALGVLGIVGVQMRTLNDTRAGVNRGYAIHLIEDLAERIQNNPDALSNLEAYTESPTTSTNCTATACAPAALATFDIKEWRENVAAALPNSDATVFIPKGGARQLGVLIGWNEKNYSQSGAELSATDKTALNAQLAKIIPTGTKDSEDNDIACPSNMICHLQYIQPTQRCTPWSIGENALYCPN